MLQSTWHSTRSYRATGQNDQWK